MAVERFKELWERIRPKVKEQWSNLTDEDLDTVKGETANLCALLQSKCGYTKKEADAAVDRLLNEAHMRW